MLIACFVTSLARAEQVVQAVWKTIQVRFTYRATTTYYSCSSLRDTVASVLHSIGARDNVRVRTQTCDEFSNESTMLITLESPVEATQANVEQLTTYSSVDELTARVRGERLRTAQDLARFAAEWKTVSFTRNRIARLQASDCELLRQLRDQVFSKLAVRVDRDHLRCSMFGAIGRPRLTVTALMAV
jgi:hypothetical protein